MGALIWMVLWVGAAPAEAAALENLTWMAGCWEHVEANGNSTEECWLPERANLMLGMHRSVKDRYAWFEYLRVENRKEGITYVASPKGEGTTEFKLVKMEKQAVVFENAGHDFPQRIRYWLDGNGKLHARVEDMKATRGTEWVWTRVKR